MALHPEIPLDYIPFVQPSIPHPLWKYKHSEIIGEGTFGRVWKAIDRQSGKTVALKWLNIKTKDASSLREVETLRKLKHANIVALEDVLTRDDRVFLVFEYLAMDLRKCIDEIPSKQVMGKAQRKSYLHQILQGISYCHQNQIIHRDLKPQNLLVDGHGGLKLADFGLARTIDLSANKRYTEGVGSRYYRAPELLLGSSQYSAAIDIWSIGCIFSEMATKLPLFRSSAVIDQIFRIFRMLSTPTEETWPGVTRMKYFQQQFPQFKGIGLAKKLGKRMDPDDIRIMQEILVCDPAQRISAAQLLRDPYFEDDDRTEGNTGGNSQLPL